uniref:Uncharacterized protein n=1 Tax=Haemonchus contortus TaxID=6289 RepID=A0A7I4Y9A0_HAECO
MENTIPDLQGPIQQTWSLTVKATCSAHKRVMGQKKVVYKHWHRTRASEGLAAYGSSKRLAKAAVGKTKDTERDTLYEKLDSRKGVCFPVCQSTAPGYSTHPCNQGSEGQRRCNVEAC